MNDHQRLQRSIATWMADEGQAARNDRVLDQILTTTADARPQPRWVVLIKEPPMRRNARVAVGSPTIRLALVAALVLLALAATAVVGAQVIRPPTVDDWPSFRGSSDRTSVAVSGPVGQPVTRWTFHAAAGFNAGTAISGDLVLAPSADGVVHAIGIDDGQERWSYRAGAPVSGATASDGLAFVTGGDGTVHALDIATGLVRWSQPAGLRDATVAATGDGRVYIATGDDRVVALDARTGKEAWRVTVPSDQTTLRTPAFADGLVYTGSRGSGLVALDAATGTVRWRADLGGDLMGTAVVAGGIVWTGNPGDGQDAHLRAFDAATGELRQTNDGPDYSPAIQGSLEVTGSEIGLVTGRDPATGSIHWTRRLQGGIRGPAISHGVVYLSADLERRLYALDGATGNVYWTYEVDASNACCIAVARGLVVVGTAAGTLYAIAGDGSAMVAQAASTLPLPSPGNTASVPAPAARGPLPDPFTVAHELSSSDLGIASAIAVAVGPTGLLYITDVSDHLTVAKPDGTVVHRWGGTGTDPGRFEFSDPTQSRDPAGALAVGQDGTVYVSDSGNHRIQVFDRDGRFVRQFGSFGSGPGQFVVPFDIAVDPAGNVLAEDDGSERLTKFSPAGDVLWTVSGASDDRLLGHGHSPTFDPDGRIVVSDDDNGIVSYLDPKDGTVLDSFKADGCAATLDSAGYVYVDDCGGSRVDVYAPDHRHVAATTATPMFAPRFGPDGLVAARTPIGSIVILDVHLPQS